MASALIPMSISPLRSSANQVGHSHRPKSDRLTLSQALLITAGLAGLVGLFSGVVIRFSLSNSDSARFLSPLQTFPSLSTWAPELPQGTADAHYLPGGTSLETGDGLQAPSRIQTFESVDEFSDEEQAIESFAPSTFDSFADRDRDSRRTYEENYPEVEEPIYDDGTYYEDQGQEQY